MEREEGGKTAMELTVPTCMLKWVGQGCVLVCQRCVNAAAFQAGWPFYEKTSCAFFQGALCAVPAEAGLAGTQADQAVLNCW